MLLPIPSERHTGVDATQDIEPAMADRSFVKLDEIADSFERQLEEGEIPRIEDYLAGLGDETERLAALRELIEIELEHAFRRDAQLAAAATSGLLIDDYVRRFPQLAASDHVASELAVAEYRARHRFGDAPRMEAFVERFPRRPGIKQQLRQVLTRMLKAQVRVYERTALLLITPFDQEFHLGRQRSTDPEPHRRVDEPHRTRLLIAPADDRSVSREHLVVERTGRQRLSVKNVSRTARVTVDSQVRIECGSVVELDMPVLLQVGSRLVRIETIESVRG